MTDKTERHECPNCAHWLTITRPEVDNTALNLMAQMAEALKYWASALGSLQPRTLQLWQSNGLLKTAEALTAYEEFKKGLKND